MIRPQNILTTIIMHPHQERISNIEYNLVNGRCGPVKDLSAPVYVNIGDGGNIEGLATK